VAVFESRERFTVIVIALLGAVLCVLPMVRIRKLRRDLATGVAATATVAENQIISRSTGGVNFRPLVTFRTSDGREIRALVATVSDSSFIVGSTMTVSYSPDNPELVHAAGQTERPLWMIAGFGAFMLVLGLWVVLKTGF
jgi:hypothetical protein